MARIALRDNCINVGGVVGNPATLDTIWADVDWNPLIDALQNGAAGINPEQLEINSNACIASDRSAIFESIEWPTSTPSQGAGILDDGIISLTKTTGEYASLTTNSDPTLRLDNNAGETLIGRSVSGTTDLTLTGSGGEYVKLETQSGAPAVEIALGTISARMAHDILEIQDTSTGDYTDVSMTEVFVSDGTTFDYGWLTTVDLEVYDGASGNSAYLVAGTPELQMNYTKVLGVQGSAVADPTGGGVIDVQCRAQLAALLAELRASTGHGLIA